MGSTFLIYARTLTYLPKIIMNKTCFWIAFVTIAFVIVSRIDAKNSTSVNAAGAVEAVEAEFEDLRAKVEALSTPCEALEALEAKIDNQTAKLTAKLEKLTALVKHMASPTKLKIITEDGTAGASSAEYPGTEERAFTDSSTYWANVHNKFPALIWKNFPNKHILAKIAIRHPHVTSINNRPEKFQIIASNDCSSWHDLLTVNNGGYTSNNQMKTWVIPTQYRAPYSCIGARWPTAGNGRGYVSVSEIVMWEMGH